MIRSGSTSWTNLVQASSICASLSNDRTSEPTMCAHELSVKMFLTNGVLSPCRVTMLAIWMTGSCCASGKTPLRPAHSMSKLSTRSGAIFAQSPSGACEVILSCVVSTSIWTSDAFEAPLRSV